ncbi:MAG TPA: ATP-binding protein [Firmicutes bacterium]|nr:ATP-binding protein [Bacillota bacterium]
MPEKILPARLALSALTVLRPLLDDPLLAGFAALLRETAGEKFAPERWLEHYSSFYAALLQRNSRAALSDCLLESLLFTETAFSRACAQAAGEAGDILVQAMLHDLAALQQLAELPAGALKAFVLSNAALPATAAAALRALPEWRTGLGGTSVLPPAAVEVAAAFAGCTKWPDCLPQLAAFYRRHGSGKFARYLGFRWENSSRGGVLRGIDTVDPVRFADLMGYEEQRRVVAENTQLLLQGLPANNLLLYGDRGTGKSSTVKALLNEYGHLGLRLIEVPQTALADLPLILREVKGYRQKFILFVDDLSFAEHGEYFTALKAVLEGGLEHRPPHVVIYATSNRRHLVREKFSERAGLHSGEHDDEVRAADNLQEKLSLADRFGLTITFLAPDQGRYLELVEKMAHRRGLAVGKEELRREALRWERWQNSRSPRTARQFVDWLEGRLKLAGPAALAGSEAGISRKDTNTFT